MCQEALDILDKLIQRRYKGQYTLANLSEIDDYVFYSQGSRMTSRAFNFGLEKVCRYANIPVRTSHKIRKTVASLLCDNNVPLEEIQKMLGHTNLATTLAYLYNPQTSKETEALIEKALSTSQYAESKKGVNNEALGNKIIDFKSAITQRKLKNIT